MKKLIYSLGIAFFIAGTVNATTIEPSETVNLKTVKTVKTVKIEKVETFEKLIDGKKVFFTRYRGRCIDGTTFLFEANSRDEAQGYVNGVCAARRFME